MGAIFKNKYSPLLYANNSNYNGNKKFQVDIIKKKDNKKAR